MPKLIQANIKRGSASEHVEVIKVRIPVLCINRCAMIYSQVQHNVIPSVSFQLSPHSFNIALIGDGM